MMLRSQVQSNTKTREAEERRLQSHQDQEKHWKVGYENIYSKYASLKEQLTSREDECRRLEDYHE